jgi:hypothetical protein
VPPRLAFTLALAALAVALVAAAAALTLLDRNPAAAPPAAPAFVSEHPVAVPEELRTVAVSTAMPMPSAAQRRLSAMLEEGAMPARPMMATVVTDTDCVPDEEMISRCRNEMLLEDGSTIVLRHPHDMTDVPCLAPGEQVRLLPLA